MDRVGIRYNISPKDKESAHEWLFEEFEATPPPFSLQWILMHLPEVDSPECWVERIRAAALSDDAPEKFMAMADGRGRWRDRK